MAYIPDKIKERLFKNWGVMAETFQCNAEVRLYDALSCWECYLLAINPENEDEAFIFSIDEMRHLEIGIDSLSHILSTWNSEGEFMEIDGTFVPRKANALLEILKQRYPF